MLNPKEIFDVTNDLHEHLSTTADACNKIGEAGGSPIQHLLLTNQHTLMRANHLIVKMLADLDITTCGVAVATKALAGAIPGIAKNTS